MIERRYLRVDEARKIPDMGKNQFRRWAEEIGAVRRIGPKTLRYDREVIVKALSKCETEATE